jgi:hypothetical protein
VRVFARNVGAVKTLVIALCFVALAGCKKNQSNDQPAPVASADPAVMEKGARDKFATQHNCTQDQITAKTLESDAGADHVMFELTGCNRTQTFDCRPRHAGGVVDQNTAECFEPRQAPRRH